MAREKTVERKNFSRETRSRILLKSNNKCAHCGVGLDEYRHTIDHFIPLSKGGTNIETNLICLCRKCNEAKDDLVLDPRSYYRYANEKTLNDFSILYDIFVQDKSWFTTRNYTREDITEIPYPVAFPSMQSHLKKKGKDGCYVGTYFPTAILKKANYDELEEIYEFVKKYHEKYDIPKDYLREILSQTFMLGAIYTVKKGGELIGVVPIMTEKLTFSNVTGYVLSMRGLPWIKLNEQNINILLRALAYIFGNIASINKKHNCVVGVSFPKNDVSLHNILYPQCSLYTSDDDWEKVFINFRIAEDGLCTCGDIDMDKEIKKTSDFLQKAFSIKEIAQKEIKNRPKKKRTRKDFRFYDEELDCEIG